MLNPANTDVYTDFNGLATLKNEAKDKSPETIKQVAKQFESVFVGMMIKSMRQAKLADGILDSDQSEFYRDMYDQQLSLHLAGKRGIGLADMIVKQLSPDQSVTVAREQNLGDYQRQRLIRPAPTNRVEELDKQTIEEVIGQSQLFDSKDDFINQLRPYAQQAAKKLGVEANVLLAQAALETGWGKAVIKSENGRSSHNLFNIKADKSWQGPDTQVSTLEVSDGVAKKEMAGFRAYDSYAQSFEDYVHFIKTNPRYRSAIKMAENPARYMHELQQAGYATDPKYAEKVMQIYQNKALNHPVSDIVAIQQNLSSDNS